MIDKEELYKYLKKEGILIKSKPDRFQVFIKNIKDIREENKLLKTLNKNIKKENCRLREEVLTCQICERKFENIKGLRNHIRTHRNQMRDPLDEIFVDSHSAKIGVNE